MRTGKTDAGRRAWRDEVATTTLEYALLLALVALTSVATYQILGQSTADSTLTANQRMTTIEQPASSHDRGDGAPAAPTGS